jgi:nicotinamidase-related amidase
MEELAATQVYERAGFGGAVRWGPRPAVVVVDFTYGFSDPIYPTAADMSEAINATARLLEAARAKSVPVAFTTISYDPGHIGALPWLRKSAGMAALRRGSRLVEVDDRLRPRKTEPLVSKLGASAFFGTNLAILLASWGVDTVVVTGATTSGCVRASVVDAVQAGYDVLVPADCVADRAVAPHEANLFDIGQKYADVSQSSSVIEYIETL